MAVLIGLAVLGAIVSLIQYLRMRKTEAAPASAH